MRSASAKPRTSSPYAELVAVMALTWLVLGVHAASPMDIRLGDWSLTRPHVALGKQPPTPGGPLARPTAPGQGTAGTSETGPKSLLTPSADNAPTGARPAVDRDDRPPIDHRPQRILLFGDSMVLVIAPRLTDYCARNGHELFPVVWYGATIMVWGWQWRLDELISEFRPSMVVAVLGSSELRARDAEARRLYIETIARKVGNRKFAWIGPPNWRDDTGINALLLDVLGPERFFDSASLELERKKDGIHPTEESGARWVDHFVSWLINESAFPIELARPDRRTSPVPARLYHELPEYPELPGAPR